MNGGRIAILAALFAVVGPVGAESAHKVLVLGVDGLDPKLLQSYVDQGKLPNFKRLIAEGDFKPLPTTACSPQTTTTAESFLPSVSW